MIIDGQIFQTHLDLFDCLWKHVAFMVYVVAPEITDVVLIAKDFE